MSTPLQRRFWALADVRGQNECWPWRGHINAEGYGSMHVDGRNRRAHRIAYELEHGPQGQDVVIRHLCNNRCCVNYRHLRAGTHADNQRDKVVSGRQAKGSGNGRAKLVEREVRDILRRFGAGESQVSLAREYGVSEKAIRLIRQGKNWRCVTARPEQAQLAVSP